MEPSPNIQAIFTLINARHYLGFCWDGADSVVTSALWRVIWDLPAAETAAGCLLVSLDLARKSAARSV